MFRSKKITNEMPKTLPDISNDFIQSITQSSLPKEDNLDDNESRITNEAKKSETIKPDTTFQDTSLIFDITLITLPPDQDFNNTIYTSTVTMDSIVRKHHNQPILIKHDKRIFLYGFVGLNTLPIPSTWDPDWKIKPLSNEYLSNLPCSIRNVKIVLPLLRARLPWALTELSSGACKAINFPEIGETRTLVAETNQHELKDLYREIAAKKAHTLGSFDNLYRDIFYLITSYLHTREIQRLGKMNKYFHSLINGARFNFSYLPYSIINYRRKRLYNAIRKGIERLTDQISAFHTLPINERYPQKIDISCAKPLRASCILATLVLVTGYVALLWWLSSQAVEYNKLYNALDCPDNRTLLKILPNISEECIEIDSKYAAYLIGDVFYSASVFLFMVIVLPLFCLKSWNFMDTSCPLFKGPERKVLNSELHDLLLQLNYLLDKLSFFSETKKISSIKTLELNIEELQAKNDIALSKCEFTLIKIKKNFELAGLEVKSLKNFNFFNSRSAPRVQEEGFASILDDESRANTLPQV